MGCVVVLTPTEGRFRHEELPGHEGYDHAEGPGLSASFRHLRGLKRTFLPSLFLCFDGAFLKHLEAQEIIWTHLQDIAKGREDWITVVKEDREDDRNVYAVLQGVGGIKPGERNTFLVNLSPSPT